MGVVYKAQDQRLKRVVAPKVIREFDSDDKRRRRFWQEARAAAHVARPSACRIYDISEDQDRVDGIRTRPEFTALLRQAGDLQREAVAAGGDTLFGLRADAF